MRRGFERFSKTEADLTIGPLSHPGLADDGKNGRVVATAVMADTRVTWSEWNADLEEVKANHHSREARLIQWIVGMVAV